MCKASQVTGFQGLWLKISKLISYVTIKIRLCNRSEMYIFTFGQVLYPWYPGNSAIDLDDLKSERLTYQLMFLIRG